jgi:xylulokinase
MPDSDLLMAIDVDTSSVKVGAFDVLGRLIARASAGYETVFPRPEWAEQDPDDWWSACVRAIRAVTASIPLSRWRGLCVTGQAPAPTCVGEHGRPVRRSPIWADRRAQAEQVELRTKLHPASVPGMLPALLWFSRHQRALYDQTRWIFQSFEYISFRLTGEVAAVSAQREGPVWSPEQLEAAEIDAAKLPARICRVGEIVGALTGDFAAEVGLPVGLPVIAGTVDSFASWVATATASPGMLCNTTGTTSSVALVCDRRIRDPNGRIGAMRHVINPNWVLACPLSSGGNVVNWFAREFYRGEVDPLACLTADAASVQSGAEGVTVLPYIAGERAPVLEPNARCGFFGISERTTRAHLARAVLESVAFAVRDVCDVIEEIGGEIDEVHLAGPAAHNLVWNQIRADVLGRPASIPEVGDSGLLGAAVVAARGVGLYADFDDAMGAMVRVRTILEPNVGRSTLYRERFEVYQGLACAMRDLNTKIAQRNRVDVEHADRDPLVAR